MGFAFGVLAVKNGIPAGLAVAMAVLMFSGSGQFVFASLWGGGAGILSTAAAVGIVNLRYRLMSAAESPWLSRLPRAQRFLLGLGLTDETFAVHITALQEGWTLNAATMYVCNSTTHLSWVGGCAIAAFCGPAVAPKAGGMSQWNVAVATVAGASLGLALSLRARRGAPEEAA